ncbi:hypothetical protein LINPERHAP2_LOCUS34697 [Linum perenne]
MAGREVREYTNLTDPKERKLGKGKDKVDDEDVTFHRMVAKVRRIASPDSDSLWILAFPVGLVMRQMQEVAGERGGYLHGRGALDSDDLLYLKEQMEAEEDAERLLRRTEKRAFAAFKISFFHTSPASIPLPLRVEPKPKSGIRQQDLLKKVVEVKPKRPRIPNRSDGEISIVVSSKQTPVEEELPEKAPVKSLLGLAYESSDDED